VLSRYLACPALDWDATLEAQQRVTARPEFLGTGHADQRNALLLIGGLQNQPRSEVPEEGQTCMRS
jgi:hypothetical protein